MNLTKLWLGGIPWSWNESDVLDLIEEYTGMESAIVSLNKDKNGKSEGHCRIEIPSSFVEKMLKVDGVKVGKTKLSVRLYNERKSDERRVIFRGYIMDKEQDEICDKCGCNSIKDAQEFLQGYLESEIDKWKK